MSSTQITTRNQTLSTFPEGLYSRRHFGSLALSAVILTKYMGYTVYHIPYTVCHIQYIIYTHIEGINYFFIQYRIEDCNIVLVMLLVVVQVMPIGDTQKESDCNAYQTVSSDGFTV